MAFFLFFIKIFSLFFVLVSSISFTEFANPNFYASNIRFVDADGAFLFSRNGTYKAAMFNPGGQQVRFYLCVIHVESNTITWSANHDSPVSNSGIMSLTTKGISINEENGSLRWSTPALSSLVSSLQLTETGNLILLDQSNSSLWESFDYPTDTIVIGQKLHLQTSLSSAVSSDDLSKGAYTLSLSTSDAILQWQDLTYWKLSMVTKAYVNSNYAVEYMQINQTGLYLYGQNGSAIVIQLNLPLSEFRIAKVDISGQLIVSSFFGGIQSQDFVAPVDECRIPYICGTIGLCSGGVSANSHVCSCPLSFRMTSNSTNCIPADSSYSLPASCNSTDKSSYTNSLNLSYLQLGNGVDYFANHFTMPTKYVANVSLCQDICSKDCFCLGIFYENSSGSCYILENKLGSVMLTSTGSNGVGFIKTLVRGSQTKFGGFENDAFGFPAAAVLMPLCGTLFMFIIGILLWRRFKFSNNRKEKISFSNSIYPHEVEFSIPGLPLRFEYEELKAATLNFKIRIGTGGFGTVYKGILPDKTLVAVKRITNIGIRGKKDFCTEIAVIGNIHHVNLVKLKGFCTQWKQWLLVYEYMNRGSLDKTLFGNGPVLEWQERVEIALGVARGLAYLHSGCEKKIIHCDVKPENILLHDHFHAKLSDFGLSKLLSTEQSSQFTTMRGTRGYLAPEWLTSSAISDKTDVYSFGMVLLELVSGRKNCLKQTQSHSLDESCNDDGNLSFQRYFYFPIYALEMHTKGRYLDLVDPRLNGRVTCGEVEKLVRVALCCVHEEPGLRPTMVSVVGMLEGEIPLGNPRMESLNFLRFYGRRFSEGSAESEENGGAHDDVASSYPDENGSQTSNRSVSNATFSPMSSQQVSGPR